MPVGCHKSIEVNLEKRGSISIFVKKKIVVTEMYITVNDVCEYDLINILKVIIAEYTEVRI